eukprot:8973390-Heterocapsa_arctica.AAC.2
MVCVIVTKYQEVPMIQLVRQGAAAAPAPAPTPAAGQRQARSVTFYEKIEYYEAMAEEAAPAAKETVSSKECPDFEVEHSRQGVEKAKNEGNSLLTKGSLEEAVRWFSKGPWLVDSKMVTDVPSNLHLFLHSNRSLAYIKLKKWAEAEADCSAALSIKPKYTKATFRRAIARFELGHQSAALEDVEQVLKENLDAPANKEVWEMGTKLLATWREQRAPLVSYELTLAHARKLRAATRAQMSR